MRNCDTKTEVDFEKDLDNPEIIPTLPTPHVFCKARIYSTFHVFFATAALTSLPYISVGTSTLWFSESSLFGLIAAE